MLIVLFEDRSWRLEMRTYSWVCLRYLSPTLDEVNKIKEALLVSPLLSSAVYSLDTEMLVVIAEFPVVRPRPSKSTNELYTVLPNCLQAFIEIRLVVKRARAIKLLILLRFQRLSEDWKSEFSHGDRSPECVI